MRRRPPGSAGVPPASLFLRPTSHPRHSLTMCMETAFKGICSIVPSLVRAGSPPGSAGVPPATLFLQPASQPRHTLTMCMETAFEGNSSIVPSLVRAGSPPGARASRPHPYSCNQPPIHGTPLRCAWKPPLRGSVPLCQALCGREAPRERGRPARILIPATSLLSTALPYDTHRNRP